MSAAPVVGTAPEESTRDALTRVLAGEGRNALARVELAASELTRVATTPSGRSRLEVIRRAVEEIAGLLARIEGLTAAPATTPAPGPGVSFAAIAEVVTGRLRPLLAARGLALEWSCAASDAPRDPARVGVPSAVLEALCLDLVRLAASDATEGAAIRLEVASDAKESRLEVSVRGSEGDAFRGTPSAEQIELEVVVADLGGRLVGRNEKGTGSWCLGLPRVRGSADG